LLLLAQSVAFRSLDMSQENTKELLWLQSKQIGDASVTALTKFAHGGALASITKIYMGANQATYEGKKAMRDVAKARGFSVNL